MIPPRATARTTARDVQLRAVPFPTQRSGREVSTARASRGTGTAALAGAASTSRAMRASSGRIVRAPPYASCAPTRAPS